MCSREELNYRERKTNKPPQVQSPPAVPSPSASARSRLTPFFFVTPSVLAPSYPPAHSPSRSGCALSSLHAAHSPSVCAACSLSFSACHRSRHSSSRRLLRSEGLSAWREEKGAGEEAGEGAVKGAQAAARGWARRRRARWGRMQGEACGAGGGSRARAARLGQNLQRFAVAGMVLRRWIGDRHIVPAGGQKVQRGGGARPGAGIGPGHGRAGQGRAGQGVRELLQVGPGTLAGGVLAVGPVHVLGAVRSLSESRITPRLVVL